MRPLPINRSAVIAASCFALLVGALSCGTGVVLGLSGDSGCSSGPHLHVNLLRSNTSWDKENSLPLNYRNADGPLTTRRALVQDAKYTARAPGP